MYDIANRLPLSIIQEPLIVMEVAFVDSKYVGLGYTDQAADEAIKLKQKCRKVNGNFTLLWHNHNLVTAQQRKIYTKILTS